MRREDNSKHTQLAEGNICAEEVDRDLEDAKWERFER